MKLTISKQIGKRKYIFNFEGNDLFEVIHKSQHISFGDLKGCGKCQSDNLYFYAIETEKENYQYVKVCCADCRANLTLGKTKKEGAYFYRRNEDNSYAWEIYNKEE